MKDRKVKAITPKDTTITLCMIVKNETHIIEECLKSMLPFIDRYDITDTGSTDGTPELIKKFMDEHGVEGEVYLSDWKGFGDSPQGIGSRTESLRNCDGKADFAWVIDADDFVDGDFKFPSNMKQWDVYSLKIQRGDFTWWRNQIFRTGIGWHYTGILHEYADCDKKPFSQTRINGNYHIEARTMGARNVGISPVEKYSRDAEMLLDALTNEESPFYDPNNHRYWFYLAQSYFDSQQVDNAMEAYQKRAELGGWEEEVYYSLFRVAICSVLKDDPWEKIQQHFLDAYAYRPIRAEPLHQLSRLYRGAGKYNHAYLFAQRAVQIDYPPHDILFLSDDVYQWQSLDELAATAFYSHDWVGGKFACEQLLKGPYLPDSERERVENNLKMYNMKIQEINQQKMAEQQQERQMNVVNRMQEAKEKKEAKEAKKNKVKKSTRVESKKNKYKKRKTAKR